jgi:hypothetical protein
MLMGTMPTLRRPLSLLAVLLLLLARTGAGDPPAAPPGEPPAPPGAGEPAQEPGLPGPAGALQTPDVFSFLSTFERQVGQLKSAPEHTTTDHALYDAWHAILAPRAGRMAGRVKTLSERARWVYAPDGRPLHLEPDNWETVVREVANLYTELDGALQQYKSVRIDYVRPTTMGLTPPEPGPPDPDAQARALGRLESAESSLLSKVSTGQVIWVDEVLWYYALLRRAEAEAQKYEADLERWNRQVQAFEDLRARTDYGLSFKRQTLSLLKFSLRALTSTLQVGEEDRLRKLVEPLPAGSEPRLAADRLLQDLRTARNAAESHGGAASAGWGSLLRSKWMTPRRRLLELLGKVEADAKAKAKAAAAAGAAPASPGAPAAGPAK